ncbi:serine hydrolase domain-containing protein [Fulvivirga lutea]|uniref:Beta-lactamase family protein n=1 Tax=Fulvivirga lutea TaxID=2810512 RepID=A0A974ZZN7_9BACT|nr:serine hydrolase domain-containing protein [Fulvivirga lutea]QSE95936.1 beta-lactamase family protein [Fulvivirga lutea]
MKVVILIVLSNVLFALKTYSQENDTNVSMQLARHLLTEHMSMTNIPGLQIAVAIDGETVWNESFGYRDIENKLVVDNMTQFRIGSVSKSITSIALARLVEEQKIQLSSTIRALVPDYPKKEYDITIEQLASSTSGVRHYRSSEETHNTKHYDYPIEALDIFKNDALLFEPGTNFEYSSYGWTLIAAAMQKATGMTFESIMQQLFLEVGMPNTTFDKYDLQSDHRTIQYIYKNDKKRETAPDEDRSFMYAGGGYLSTATDLVQFGNVLLENTYISKTTFEEFTRPRALPNGESTFYALGWESGVSRLNTPIIYHSGSMQSARAHVLIYPEHKLVMAYVANTGSNVFFNDREAQSLAELFLLQDNNMLKNATQLDGEWNIETTSLAGKKSTGLLRVSTLNNVSTVMLEFTRSRKKEEYKGIVYRNPDGQFRIVAVTPMFLDMYLTLDGNTLTGHWLHDFNVNGKPEQDDYWKPRDIKLIKLN